MSYKLYSCDQMVCSCRPLPLHTLCPQAAVTSQVVLHTVLPLLLVLQSLLLLLRLHLVLICPCLLSPSPLLLHLIMQRLQCEDSTVPGLCVAFLTKVTCALSRRQLGVSRCAQQLQFQFVAVPLRGGTNTPMQESCLQRVLSVHVKACIILYTSAGAGRASSGVSCWVGSRYSSSAIDTLPCKSCGTHVSCCVSGMSHMYFCCCRHYNHAGQDWCTLTCHASVLRASSVCAHAQCANSLILLPQFSEW